MSTKLSMVIFLVGLLTTALASESFGRKGSGASVGRFLEEFRQAVAEKNFASFKKYVDLEQRVAWSACEGSGQLDYLTTDQIISMLSERSLDVKIDVTPNGYDYEKYILSIQTIGWTDQKFLYFYFEEMDDGWRWRRTCHFPAREPAFRLDEVKLKDPSARDMLRILNKALHEKDFSLLTRYSKAKNRIAWDSCGPGDVPGPEENLSMQEMLDRLRKRSANKAIEITAISVEDQALTVETIRWSDQPFLYFFFGKERGRWQWTAVCHFPIRDREFHPTE